MRTHRFGRKIELPATIAIKHQIRIRMAQDEIKKAEIEATQEGLPGNACEELPAKWCEDYDLSRVRRPAPCQDFDIERERVVRSEVQAMARF
jgi:hypothetical protein